MSRHAHHPHDLRRAGRHGAGPRGHGPKDTYRLERRRETRHEAAGSLRASYSSDGRFGITHLDLIDRSPSGLGASSRARIERGATVMICPEGSTIPWLSARVVRCEERDGEFVVGMRYTGAATAA
jgi:hypothetical protein